MKKTILVILVGGITLAAASPGYASDWDKAGKALAIIEGARIITGGNIDLIGNLTGINRNSWFSSGRGNRGDDCRTYARAPRRPERVWVPHYVWKKKYIPGHEEYDEKYGNIIVEEHYIKYRVENGGHWE